MQNLFNFILFIIFRFSLSIVFLVSSLNLFTSFENILESTLFLVSSFSSFLKLLSGKDISWPKTLENEDKPFFLDFFFFFFGFSPLDKIISLALLVDIVSSFSLFLVRVVCSSLAKIESL